MASRYQGKIGKRIREIICPTISDGVIVPYGFSKDKTSGTIYLRLWLFIVNKRYDFCTNKVCWQVLNLGVKWKDKSIRAFFYWIPTDV